MQIIHNPRFHDYTTFVLGHTQKIKRGCLSFKMVNPRLHGNYTLIVTNEYGTANKTIPYHTMAPSKYNKTFVKRTLSKRPQIGFQYHFRLMQVKGITTCSKVSILQYFRPSLSKNFVVSIFELPFIRILKIKTSAKTMHGPRGGQQVRTPPPSPSRKSQNYRFHYKYWFGSPLKITKLHSELSMSGQRNAI